MGMVQIPIPGILHVKNIGIGQGGYQYQVLSSSSINVEFICSVQLLRNLQMGDDYKMTATAVYGRAESRNL